MQHYTDRLHYMDNLRAVVMIAGVFFHAAMAYSPMLDMLWFTSNADKSPSAEIFTQFMHLFRMPLFFVVAGFFAALLIDRKGIGAMFKNRLLRIGVPLVLFWPLVTAALVMPMLWAAQNIENPSPLLGMVKFGMDNPDYAPPPQLLIWHLWFLYYLMFFYLLTWVARTLPLGGIKRALLSLHPAIALALLPLLLIPGLAITFLPFGAPDKLIPQAWAFLFYGPFFAYGYFLFSNMRLLDYVEPLWYLLLIASAVLFVPFWWFIPEMNTMPPEPAPWPGRLVLIVTSAYISVWMSVAGLVLARKFLDQRNSFMRLMSDASYWIYLAHLPIVVAVQYPLLETPWPWWAEFLISSFATLAICTLTYFVLVRWSPLGWLLNGRRKPMLRLA